MFLILFVFYQVFQPYLRICVLPGDSWTCDILATDPPETTTTTPELVDPTLTSYLAYGEDAESKFGESIDSFYKGDREFGQTDNVQQTVTPYPLIEATSEMYSKNQVDNDVNNIGLPIAIKHSEDNYLYRFINGQQVLATPSNANNNELQAHLERLTKLMERLLAYQSSGLPLDRQPQWTTTMSPAQDSAVLNFLIKNYASRSQEDVQEEKNVPAQTESTDLLLNTPDAADNIVVVTDSLNNHQYFTISKYKSIAHQLTTEFVELIPCTQGVRHANSSDCTKYYSCEPETAKITQFSCPSNTAFNQYRRLCERAEYILCNADSSESTLKISATTKRPKPKTRDAAVDSSPDVTKNENPCQSLGKHGDPTSDSHYYLCYSDNGKSLGDMKYRRMVCPTSLIFCKSKSLCTIRQRCDTL